VSQLRRSTPLARKPMRKKPVVRDWSDCDHKRGPCRVCNSREFVHLHHLAGRLFDKRLSPTRRWVDPDGVIPLCANCHVSFHNRKLSLVGYLTLREYRWVVRICREKGLNARLRLGGKR
jgi:5-methylcytosine-specific restriction endonuclease McrA